MRPRGDRWNPRFDFESLVIAAHPEVAAVDFGPAIAVGTKYLNSVDYHAVDHKSMRAEYHRVILGELGVANPADSLIEALDAPLPFTDIVEPFADVADGLSLLAADGWRMSIVADTGPQMADVYRHHGLDHHFEAFVTSAEVGVSKPDIRMFRTASDAMGLQPSECIFVDDNPDNLRGALGHGYHACGISRYGKPPADDLEWVTDLSELRALLLARR